MKEDCGFEVETRFIASQMIKKSSTNHLSSRKKVVLLPPLYINNWGAEKSRLRLYPLTGLVMQTWESFSSRFFYIPLKMSKIERLPQGIVTIYFYRQNYDNHRK